MKNWLGALILGGSGLLVLCALGFWQLQRLAWKEDLIAGLERQMQAAPMGFADLPRLEGDVSGTPFEGTGVIRLPSTDVLTGHKSLGAGYRRIYVFEAGGQRIAMEAGFLPEAAKNDDTIAPPSGEITIQGHLYTPQNGEGSYDTKRDIWIGYNLDEMAELLGVAPVILVAKESPVSGLQDAPFEIKLPNNHLQYAITWFALAVVWGAMALYWGSRRAK